MDKWSKFKYIISLDLRGYLKEKRNEKHALEREIRELEREASIYKSNSSLQKSYSYNELSQSDNDTSDGFLTKVFKVITGIKAYQNRKKAKRIKEKAERLYYEIIAENERRRDEANEQLEEFGRIRLTALQSTVKVFLSYLRVMKFKSIVKEYDISGKVSLNNDDIGSLERIDMNSRELLGTTVAAGSMAATAIAGVPTIVTSAVSQFAMASTGTAIHTLHGAAATNATLAWLGGGSLASGGGGIAAGTAVLNGIVGLSAGILAIASLGILSSMHYSKKLTAAVDYSSKVDEFKEKAEAAWDLMDRIIKRASELKDVTLSLQKRIEEQLEYMEPLIYDFCADDKYYLETFQRTAMMVKSMSELSQVPLLTENGYVSNESKLKIEKVNIILNTNL